MVKVNYWPQNSYKKSSEYAQAQSTHSASHFRDNLVNVMSTSPMMNTFKANVFCFALEQFEKYCMGEAKPLCKLQHVQPGP